MRPLSLLLGALLCLCACGEDPVAGGSGTDAGNALTVTARAQDGSAVAGAQVEVWPADEVPAAQGNPPTWSGTTDGQGTARAVVGSGRWSVLVRTGAGAFRKVLASGESASDTLRSYAVLTGFVKDAAGGRLALAGLGRSVPCDSTGFFRADSLPSGALAWVAYGKTSSLAGSAVLLPGKTVVRDTAATTVVVDTLVNAVSGTLVIGKARLGDTGAFAVAMQGGRSDTLGGAWLFSWTSPSGKGIRVGMAGPDTLVLELDGTARKIAGFPLATAPLRLGLRWSGSAWQVWLDGELALDLTSASGTDRSAWTDPVLGELGMARIDWAAFEKGAVPDAWFGQSAP